jgi:hypothetical protein
MRRRLRDIQADQEAGGRKGQTIFGSWDVGEVCKVADLIRGIFGDAGVVEIDQSDPGLLKAGRFTDGKRPGKGQMIGPLRPTELPFAGRNLSDFEAQIAAWRAHR